MVVGIRTVGPAVEDRARVLTAPALAFVEDLTRNFRPRIEELLARRKMIQAQYDAGMKPHFLDETADVRTSSWSVASPASDLVDRRVEITGPVDRKMIINALNSGADVFMADFEDANSPTWENCVSGQANLMDAVRRTITYVAPETGKHYALAAKTATLVVRPRGFHLLEKHCLVDERPIPAMLFDFGLFFFHNASQVIERGSGPYFYLPKIQSHLEARLWNDIFVHAQRAIGISAGTIRATVLIETLPAAFEMDEILYELKDHSSGLTCGRWDYIFSAIKTQKNDPGFLLPDRGQVTMEAPFLRAYVQLLIKTCHRRGAHAMGGMAAQIPIKDNPEENERALEKVRADKLREVREGHDGTWVAHPGLVPIAKQVFDAGMPQPNQLDRKREDVNVTEGMLVVPPAGTRTEAGLRHNIRVGIQYVQSWLGGQGAVPIFNLMEDAATAEISRTQIWQWIRHGATLDTGRRVTKELVASTIREEFGGKPQFDAARQVFEQVATSEVLEDFLTIPAYDVLVNQE